MPSWKHRLSTASRDKRKLVIGAAIIAAVSAVLALLIDVAWRQAPIPEGEVMENSIGGVQVGHRIRPEEFREVQQALRVPESIDDNTLIWFFLQAADLFGPGGQLRLAAPSGFERGELLGRAGEVTVGEFLEKSSLDAQSIRAFDYWARAVFLDEEDASNAQVELEKLAGSQTPPKYSSLLLADVLARRGDIPGAIEALEAGEATGSDRKVRRDIVLRAIKKKDKDSLQIISESSSYLDSVDWYTRQEMAKQLRDYLGLLTALFMTTVASPPGFLFVVLALLGGGAWFAIMVGFIGFSGHRWWMFLLPVAAGVLSVVPTLFILILQEEYNGMSETGEIANDLIYYIVGVGLREEVAKLLLFALFLPLLLKKRSPAHALIAAACVGLGFAMLENIRYFHRTLNEAAIVGGVVLGTEFVRFITATCVHMFLTGSLGYALYWFCISPKRYYEQFLIAFIFAVVIHGLYDVVLSAAFANLGISTGGFVFDRELGFIIAIGIIAACAYRFFGLVDLSRIPGRRLISPLGLFVIGGAVVYGSALMAACTLVPFKEAFVDSGRAGLQFALVAWIYINRFRDE